MTIICRNKGHSNAKLREQEEPDSSDDTIENYTVRKIQQLFDSKPYMKYFPHLKGVLDSAGVNVPININENIDPVHRDRMYSLMKSVRETGFPSLSGNYDLFYFRLPSQGCHRQIHFMWNSVKSCPHTEGENARIITYLRSKQKQYRSRASRRMAKDVLHRIIGIVKPYKAEYLIRTLLGDASSPHDSKQACILQRFNQYVSLREDIICDLRENNGSKPHFDAFLGHCKGVY